MGIKLAICKKCNHVIEWFVNSTKCAKCNEMHTVKQLERKKLDFKDLQSHLEFLNNSETTSKKKRKVK